MPSLRSEGRASKACDSCRRLKTRCYPSSTDTRSCLRCQTQNVICSLTKSSSKPTSRYAHRSSNSSIGSPLRGPNRSVDERLGQLEDVVSSLVHRIDATVATPPGRERFETPVSATNSIDSAPPSEHPNQAPLLLIRDTAADHGVHSPEQAITSPIPQADIILKGLITMREVYTLLPIFNIHYGRWVRFDETLSTENLLQRVRRFPLLLCSICLIAVRHTDQDLATKLGPVLFHEASHLLTLTILTIPQPFEFFQSILILSLWSTTIGQTPLSIDSWLLTSYAIPHMLTSSSFSSVHKSEARQALYVKDDFDAVCVWTHICLAHLQYCIGTRRKSLLTQAQIETCTKILDSKYLTNFEARMVAETKLYWIIYSRCCKSQVDLVEAQTALADWRSSWDEVFNEPRSQFLQMGYHFGMLLAHCQILQQSANQMRRSSLVKMLVQCREIISLAMDHTDDRIRHLTDHIYHVITFAAITACRLLHRYDIHLDANDVSNLDRLISQLISWLKGIGLPCHAAHLLGNVLTLEQIKLRHVSGREVANVSHIEHHPHTSHFHYDTSQMSAPTSQDGAGVSTLSGYQNFTKGTNYVYADPGWSGMLDFTAGLDLWPSWDAFIQNSDEVSLYATSF